MPEIKPTQTRIINTFVDKMIADKDLSMLSAEEQAELRKNLRVAVEDRIDQAMLEALTDEQLAELERMVDNGASDDEMDQFFANSGADFTASVERAMAEFRQAFLNDTIGEE